MTLYKAIPKASDDIVEVATGTSLKTLLQVATPATTDIRILGWGVSFDGIVVTNPPGRAQLVETASIAATVTSLTPEKYGNDDGPASLCAGGTALTGYNAIAEGSVSGSRLLDAQNIHPQMGYAVYFPTIALFKVNISRMLRIRVLFSVDVNCIPWILWDESA